LNSAAMQTQITAETRAWIEQVIVKYNFCPFASRELARDSITYVVSEQTSPMPVLEELLSLIKAMDVDEAIATSLLILPHGFEGFIDYLDLVGLAEELLARLDYEGVYQLASFHPDYCFADCEQDDAANYTNRSPYPLLHILREQEVTAAIEAHDDAEGIPARNIKFARRKGADFFRELLLSLKRNG